jgi:hypothetical protein
MNRSITRTVTRGLVAAALGGAALFASTGTALADGTQYDGQECGGHTLFDVYYQMIDGGPVFEYVPVGSC